MSCPRYVLQLLKHCSGWTGRMKPWKCFRETLFNETPETVLFAINALQELGPEALVHVLPELQKVLETNENNYVNQGRQFRPADH